MDITEFINWFVSSIVSIFAYCFNWLDSITFNGTSLLRYSIALVILGVVLDVMLTLVKTRSTMEMRHNISKDIRAKDRKDGQKE